jgi:cell fate regulator YaaT (PSP1 superfamily)
MKKVVSITFEGTYKKYYFAAMPGLKIGDFVVVETVRGQELGRVVGEEKEIDDSEVVGELKPIIRKATEKDLESKEENRKMKPELLKKVKEIVSKSGLEMKVLEAEYALDKSKLVIQYTAEGRVDFRELLKSLASEFRTRIELRQVGPRDASRIVSGIGPCGRRLCCSTFLGDIQNVTIKMAKNQNLTLNPTTISGLCGKLLCCISFEDKIYQEMRAKLPDIDDEIETEKGVGKVVAMDILDESVTIRYEDATEEVISMSDLEEE